MSFPTLSRRGKVSHIKQTSFDVSELAAAGRLHSAPDNHHATERTSPLTPLKRISQFFRRHSSEPVPFAHSGSKSLDRDRIFGRRLLDICTPELPKSITELILYLQDVGPFTREIFRKPPNAKRCGLLVEKLNTISSSVEWDVDESCNGLLLAAVFKTFLREIPHKVCDNRLYHQWTAIFHDERHSSKEQRVSQVTQLISKLPEANQLLLKQTIALLYRIQQRCLENQMNSYNLSVCLGPCLLWTTSSSCREVEKASKAVVSITEFLINNCLDIFGRSILTVLRNGDNSLARKTSMSLDSIFTDKPKSYRNSHSMDTLTDQLGRQQLSPSRLSFDSGLILDDISHDSEVTNDGKAPEPIHKRLNLSYDSLDCDTYASDEDLTYLGNIAKLENNNTVYINMPSQSSKAFLPEGKRLANQGSTTGYRHNHQFKASPDVWPARSSEPTGNSTLRSPSNAETKCRRQPSISYDKITYRYIPKCQKPPTDERFYSLQRPRSQQPLNCNYYPLRRQSANPHRAELISITCGQSEWKEAEVPMIVIDKCQSEMPPPENHVTRIQLMPIPPELRATPDHRVEQLRMLDVPDNAEPIYENSELYGPSSVVPRQLNYVTQTSPLYENLPFHRHQPISRSRSKNTTNSYSTYRQQTNHSRPSLLPLFEPRTGTLPRVRAYREQQSATQTMQETCYFV